MVTRKKTGLSSAVEGLKKMALEKEAERLATEWIRLHCLPLDTTDLYESIVKLGYEINNNWKNDIFKQKFNEVYQCLKAQSQKK